MKKSEPIKPTPCRECKHSGKEENHLIECVFKAPYKMFAGSTKCPFGKFEKK